MKNVEIIKDNLIKLVIKMIVVLISFYIVLFVLFGLTRMNNNSMSSSINPGALVLFNRIDNNYEVNDVISFVKDNKKYILRVIAKEGETISLNVEGDFINKNGEDVYKNNIKNIIPDESKIEYPYTVPKNELFVVGDNREVIDDSRIYGSINKNIVEGKVIGVLTTKNI